MNLPTALKEMAGLLFVASEAAEKLACQALERDSKNVRLLVEVSSIAKRLREISNELAIVSKVD